MSDLDACLDQARTGTLGRAVPEAVSLCIHHADRSPMAGHGRGRVVVRSADSRSAAAVLADAFPKPLTDDVLRAGGEACPRAPGHRYDVGDLPGSNLDARVRRLLTEFAA